ncbi:MAG: HAMP domain-containing sensor histidine kinase [Myxococcota bacterium]
MMNAESAVFALHVDPDGRSLEVVVDGLGLLTSSTLDHLVPEGSQPKLSGFWSQLQTSGAVAGWEIPVRTTSGIRAAVLGASRLSDRVAVVGHLAGADVYDLYDELSSINNEQSTTLRNALKRVARLEANAERSTSPLLDDMTRLANEMGMLQRDLAKQNAALQRLNRQKNQLIGMVAHDLRNPLGVITQFSTLVRTKAGDRLGSRETKLLGRIEQTARFMLHIVEDLLDLSAIESGEIRLESSSFSTSTLLDEAVSLEELRASNKQTTVTIESTDSPTVHGDLRKLVQVLANLISNAIKYGPPDSTVIVGSEQRGDRVRLSVSDQGPGIPPEECSRLFQPFGTTSVKATGGEKSTGLGLLIARKVVEAHAGTIGVETELGMGSTFWVELPCKRP